MSTPFPRTISIVHSIPGRVRLRLPWLHDQREGGPPLADRLAALDGMGEIQIRPYTGSVLCAYDPERLDETRILDEVRAATGVSLLVRPGEPLPAEVVESVRRAREQGSGVARAAATFFKGVNADVLELTEGRVDLGTLAALTFAGAGVSEVAVTGRLPLPPWFQLAWWSFRTFTTMAQTAIAHTPLADENDTPPL